MTYDFTSIMDRHGKDSIAVDALGKMPGMAPEPPKEGLDAIPMWVADMNFPTVPSIPEAIIERAKHPAYGYFSPTDEYFDSIIRWQTIRNDVVGLTRESIGYENGVLGGVVSAITAFAAPGDAVLLHSPTYIGFTSCIENNGYHIVHSPLKLDEQGIWRMDFEDMDRKIKENNIHVAVFCSPHNPCGRVWERWEPDTHTRQPLYNADYWTLPRMTATRKPLFGLGYNHPKRTSNPIRADLDRCVWSFAFSWSLPRNPARPS